MGADGRIELLDEAVERAAAVIYERSELAEADRAGVARVVGLGPVKYADLSSARDKDYVFAWDRMLAMEGNASVYLQYANARIRSVLRRADAAGARAGSAITVGSRPSARRRSRCSGCPPPSRRPTGGTPRTRCAGTSTS